MALALKALKLNLLHWIFVRRLLLRVLMVASATIMLPFLKSVSDVNVPELFPVNGGNLSSTFRVGFLNGHFLKYLPQAVVPIIGMPLSSNVRVNFTSAAFEELVHMKLLGPHAKALCIGQGSAEAVSALRELGISDVTMVERHPFSSMVRKRFVSHLSFNDKSFDFIFSGELYRGSISALPVLEIERVLKPGGVGAMIVGAANSSPGSLILTATPISLFLKISEIVHVRSIESSTLVIFKKRCDEFCSFDHYRLPGNCPAVTNNKPFMEHLEPLVERKLIGTNDKISYLSKCMDISNRKQAIYIDVGAGEFANSSIAEWFLPLYPKQSQAFEIYAVDHNASVLSSYLGKTGVTFVYYPGLSEKWVTGDLESDAELSPLQDDMLEGFDFLGWFKQTVAVGDFVVLKMETSGLGTKLLHELFESGAICLVDELFLRCTNNADGQNAAEADCLHLFKALRSGGVYVHQW
ncbi:hypothetical protein ACLOJK_009324 [Asimina triloba]